MEKKEDMEKTGRHLVYFAAERTLMAWLRASLGLMALGFVIDRFGLFLRQALPQVGPTILPKVFSFWAGTMLVICGSIMATVAAVRYLLIFLEYRQGRPIEPGNGILVAIVFVAAVAIFGMIVSYFLSLATV